MLENYNLESETQLQNLALLMNHCLLSLTYCLKMKRVTNYKKVNRPDLLKKWVNKKILLKRK